MRKYLVVLFLLSGFSQAMANPVVGIVTNLSGEVVLLDSNEKLDIGDDILFNQRIRTGKDAFLVLTYYDGCREEWLAGNTEIQALFKKSKIMAGQLQKAETFDCEVPAAVLSEQDSFKKAAFHFRSVKAKSNKDK